VGGIHIVQRGNDAIDANRHGTVDMTRHQTQERIAFELRLSRSPS
jgi:hypothetical protein